MFERVTNISYLNSRARGNRNVVFTFQQCAHVKEWEGIRTTVFTCVWYTYFIVIVVINREPFLHILLDDRRDNNNRKDKIPGKKMRQLLIRHLMIDFY